MSLQSRFLVLSIKEQVCIIIFILTIFSVLVIICLPCSFGYEILREDYKQKKKYFYNKYKEYIHSCFYYQGYNLLKYEEMIKRMLKQAFKYSIRENIFQTENNFKSEYTEQYPVRDLFYNSSEDDRNRTDILYYYCFDDNEENCKAIKEGLQNKYESLYSLIFTTDMYNRFRFPELDIPILDKALSVNINNSFMFCFDKDIMLRNLKENINYEKKAKDIIDNIKSRLDDYTNMNLFLYDRLFEKIEAEINTFSLRYALRFNRQGEKFKNEILYNFSKINSGYHSSIHLSDDKSTLLTYNPDNDIFYYFEFYTTFEFLMHVHKTLSSELNMDFIPLFYENSTLFFPEICIFFMMRQTSDLFNEKIMNEFLQKIQRGNATIKDCFYYKDYYEKQSEIKEILEKNDLYFLNIRNVIREGIVDTGNDNPYYFMKYSFPNLNTLKTFQSDYLLLDQINFILFASFKEPMQYSEYIWAQYKNLFYLIIILILYLWIICLIANMLIFCKIIKQITEPIYKLQEAIELNNIKDESIFKYEYDDTINDLFITCKELLTRQIDTRNDNKYSNQFNILRKDKENLVDKSKYGKNLIINNDIMNQLINEQQNMMDLSGNIDTNNELNGDLEFNEMDSNRINKNKEINNKEENYKGSNIDNTTNKIQHSVNQNKINEDKNRESYISLFKLGEYLYYYRCKNEEDLVNIKQDQAEESSNINNSKKFMKKISKKMTEEDENSKINIFKDKDITYMWYMEAKKKKNKSFNYQISDNYEELFNDIDMQ